ncbi:MAG: carboxypeptidase regulatory-like domain-containing protein [Candidatus Acidiferrales bacterium]
MKPPLRAFALFSALAFFASAASAQIIGREQGGGGRTVSGSIAFMGGAPVAVQVTIESSNRSINRTMMSDGSGSFTASGLPPGEYFITLDAPGFVRQRESIDVTPGTGVLVFQFMLRPAPISTGATPGDPIAVASLKVPPAAHKEFEAGLADWKHNDFKAARLRFEKALEKHHDFPEALWAIAQLDLAEGQNRQALERLQRAVEIAPSFYHGQLSLSRVLNQGGQAQASLEAADKAVAARPDLWEGHYQRGLAALALSQTTIVQECAVKLESLAKGSLPEARLLRAGVLLQKGDYSAARTELEAFLEAAPQHPSAALASSILAQLKSPR